MRLLFSTRCARRRGVRAAPIFLWAALSSLIAVEVAAGEYAERAAALEVIKSAELAGVDAKWSTDLVSAAERQQSILDAIARPAEKTKPWYKYRQIFLTPRRTREGVVFWDQHALVLDAVSAVTGVPPEVIVAIIGVETFYGRITGNYRVIDALATLAFDYPRRSVFFTKELEAFLLLAWESGKDPLMLKGSYAGAMGYGQFMPSSYRAYATRFEGEGAPDIWDNPADAISSVGNYLLEHGWHADEDVVVSATVNDPEPGLFEGGLKPTHSVAQLVARGVMPSQPINSDAMATPIGLEAQDGMAYWLGLENFYVITRYNHSAMYAMAVWDLSQSIAKARKEKDL